MKRFLIWGDYNAATGFGTVLHNIVHQLSRYYKDTARFTILAINYAGPTYTEGNILVTSAKFYMPDPQLQDDYGRYAVIQELTDASRTERGMNPYDGLFVCLDPGQINDLVPSLQALQAENKRNGVKNWKSIIYFPIDHANTPRQVFSHLGFYDRLVCYNEFGRSQVLSYFPEWKKKTSVIPHGINTRQFYQLPEEKKVAFRREYFGKNADRFIVLNLNRNQPRKDIPTTIFAFKEFQATCPEAFLYLHMNPNDHLGWKLYNVLNYAGLLEGKDYMFPPPESFKKDIPVEIVNNIYNACDVYVTTTTGEGWGLTVTESMACGLPVVCPLHTSLTEITANGRRAFAVDTLYPCCNHMDNVIREQSDYIQVAERLQEVYDRTKDNEDKVLTNICRSAFDYSQQLDWDRLGNRWIDLFKQTF